MAPPDPRDAELIETVTVAVTGLIVAVNRGSPEQVMGHVALLVNAIIEHRATFAVRPSDEPLRRALARL